MPSAYRQIGIRVSFFLLFLLLLIVISFLFKPESDTRNCFYKMEREEIRSIALYALDIPVANNFTGSSHSWDSNGETAIKINQIRV